MNVLPKNRISGGYSGALFGERPGGDKAIAGNQPQGALANVFVLCLFS